MKKEPKYRQPNREDLYTEDQIQFVRENYGKLKPDDISNIIQRTRNGVHNIARRYFIKAHKPMYGQIKVTYQGRIHEVMGRRYQVIKTEDGLIKIDHLKGTKINRKSRKKLYVVEDKETYKKRMMAAHRRKPENREKKADLSRQVALVQEFEAPQGKKLVQIDKKTWVYR